MQAHILFLVILEVKKKTKWDTVAPSEPSQQPPKIMAQHVADPGLNKVTIPAVGDLFHKK